MMMMMMMLPGIFTYGTNVYRYSFRWYFGCMPPWWWWSLILRLELFLVCNLGVDADLLIPLLTNWILFLLWLWSAGKWMVMMLSLLAAARLILPYCCVVLQLGGSLLCSRAVLSIKQYVLPPDMRPCVPTEDRVYQHTNMGGPTSHRKHPTN